MITYPEQWTDQGVNYAAQWFGDAPPEPQPIVLTGKATVTIAPDRKSMTVEIDKLPQNWCDA